VSYTASGAALNLNQHRSRTNQHNVEGQQMEKNWKNKLNKMDYVFPSQK